MNLTPSFFTTASARVDLNYQLLASPNCEVIKYQDLQVQPGTPFNDPNLTITITNTKTNGDGYILNIIIQPKVDIELLHFEAKYSTVLTDLKMLANGFQSWSQTREMGANDRISDIKKTVAWYTQYNLQGDYDIYPHSGEKGLIHSSSYTHFRDISNNIVFFGSLSENVGYTYFKANFNSNIFGLYKDVEGKRIKATESCAVIKTWIHQGHDAERILWDGYASYFEDRRVLRKDQEHRRHVNGWTSWYNYYGDVSESIIMENIAALKKHKYPIDIFQIDDGFQTAIGDWLSINNKFPNGMKTVATEIKKAGFMAGLWLAPFAVGFTSMIVKKHPHWLIQDGAGKPVVAGPNWGGFYALDMYQAEARAYLKTVFDTVLRDWGFDMVKLDFCFAAAMIPRQGKSRGEIMWEAMELIRDLVGDDKLILGCGVPLAAAWRKVDYCRIGSDVANWWEDTKLKYLHVRERVSTANSLVSTLSRWSMSDTMFGNDPDVMILRHKNNKLKPDERYTLCVINNILGALVFSSDNVGDYGQDEHLLYSATFPKVVPQVESVIEFRPSVYMIRFMVQGDNEKTAPRHYTTYSNLSDQDQTLYLPPPPPLDDKKKRGPFLFFATDNDMHLTYPDRHAPLFYHPSSSFVLKTHETKTFMHIPPPAKDKVVFMGSSSHIVPGAEIHTLQYSPEQGIQVAFRQENKRQHHLYLGFGDYLRDSRQTNKPADPLIKVNGQSVSWETIQVEGRGEGRSQSEVRLAVVDL
ncbi:glycoside hydrolase superfamily [Halteromyces radiatus]|uniref:glycoside hydrolase superfamily n=1 Tax=Halteromyces radiatus TaxID=101107 RepID=UPI00221F7BFC|nr:glycoside hydrolase superfamily [Halteromyces radiatus]KAI8088996.1 glycoside hydrolase superfamily [Halteromyces radiatus]